MSCLRPTSSSTVSYIRASESSITWLKNTRTWALIKHKLRWDLDETDWIGNWLFPKLNCFQSGFVPVPYNLSLHSSSRVSPPNNKKVWLKSLCISLTKAVGWFRNLSQSFPRRLKLGWSLRKPSPNQWEASNTLLAVAGERFSGRLWEQSPAESWSPRQRAQTQLLHPKGSTFELKMSCQVHEQLIFLSLLPAKNCERNTFWRTFWLD